MKPFAHRSAARRILVLGLASHTATCSPVRLDLFPGAVAAVDSDQIPGEPLGAADAGKTPDTPNLPLPLRDAGAATEVPNAAPLDLSMAVFSTPRALTQLGTAGSNEDDPTVTADLLELYFNARHASGEGAWDIWVATRSNTQAPWGAPRLVSELSTEIEETSPGVSADGLSLWFTRHTACGRTDEIMVAERPGRAQPWGEPRCVDGLNSPVEEFGLEVTFDGLQMIFTSDRRGSNDLFISERSEVANNWGFPALLTAVNSDWSDGDGQLSAGGLTLLFASTRPGGSSDLYWSNRTSLAAEFSVPKPIAELNSNVGDTDPWLSEDQTYMLFSSERDGQQRIYEVDLRMP